MLLDIADINTYYDEAHVLHDLSLDVGEGEVVALLGRNGAGKTTTLRSIMGVQPPRTGKITFRDESIAGLNPEDIYKKGIGYISEDRGIFPHLSVRENLLVGLDRGRDPDEAFEPIFEYFPRLQERLEQDGGTLSGGEQQMLAIARTLVSNPEILLIDEPTEGLMPTLVESIADIIKQLNNDGHTILLVEQNTDMTLEIADRVFVISKGQIQFQGTPADVEANEEIVNEYLAV